MRALNVSHRDTRKLSELIHVFDCVELWPTENRALIEGDNAACRPVRRGSMWVNSPDSEVVRRANSNLLFPEREGLGFIEAIFIRIQ